MVLHLPASCMVLSNPCGKLIVDMMDGLHVCNDYIPNYQLNHPQVTQCEMDGGSSVE